MLDPVPAFHPRWRCRPHADRRTDRRRQIGAACAHGAAIPALSTIPGLRLRLWRIDPRRRARHARRLARSRRRLSSIFFGGGTPSLMPPDTVAAVIAAAEETWGLADACEITLERSEEHTSELQSLMRISYAVFCLKKKTK